MMKKASLLLMCSLMLCGCAKSSALIKENSASLRTDVYQELTNGATAPQGYVDLRVTASLKTHYPGMYSAKDIHGTSYYKMLLNIDGQAVLLQGSLQKENSELMKLVDPEAGDGIRYRFSKNLCLKPGLHKVVIALPDDEIAITREVVLNAGERNSLVVEPVYSTKPGKRRPGNQDVTGFTQGIRTFRLMLNGREI
jgi:hypothetical protein